MKNKLQMSHLCFLSGLHGGVEVFDLRLHALFVLLQFHFQPGQVLQLLAQLCHRIGVLLPQPRCRGLGLKRRFLQLPPQLQQVGLTLPVLLDLKPQMDGGCRGLKKTKAKQMRLMVEVTLTWATVAPPASSSLSLRSSRSRDSSALCFSTFQKADRKPVTTIIISHLAAYLCLTLQVWTVAD